MSDEGTAEVLVVLAARGTSDAADRAFLLAAATWALGVTPGTMALARRCPHCDGDDHGRPVVRRLTADGPGSDESGAAGAGVRAPSDVSLQVSLSRAGGTVAVALTVAGAVGLDIEAIAEVSRADFDDVAFNAVELAALGNARPQDAALIRATMWTAKEASLKAIGAGLRVDPSALTVQLAAPACLASPSGGAVPAASIASGSAALSVTWESEQPPEGLPLTGLPRLVTFDAGRGLVGTVALCGTAVPVVRLLPARSIRDRARPPSARAK